VLRPLALVPILILLGASAVPFPATAAEKTLPGGIRLAVTINSPADGAILPPGPVTVTGRAEIGDAVPTADTSLDYVLDVSGSTATTAVTGCSVDENHDDARDADGNPINDIVDCEIAAARRLNDQAVDAHTVSKVGVTVFGALGKVADVVPPGNLPPPDDYVDPSQRLTEPGADRNDNGLRDMNEVLESVYNRTRDPDRPGPPGGVGLFQPLAAGGSTSFAEGVKAANAAIGTSGDPHRIVVFMSDGQNGASTPVEDLLTNRPAGVIYHTFAIGPGNTCGSNAVGAITLQRIADKTGGICTPVPDLSRLPGIIPGVIVPQITELKLTVDGQAQPITVDPPLPRPGPGVNYSVTTDPLASGRHRLCVLATGKVGRDEDTVEDCHTVTVNAAPVVSTGGPYTAQEDQPKTITGTVTDPDDTQFTVKWSLPAGTPCTFADDTKLSTSVTCTAPGTFDLALSVSDGHHPPVVARTTLTVINTPPKVSAGGPYTGPQNQPIPIEGTATDPDDPQLTIKWSVPEGVPCTFADETKLATTVTCTGHGVFDLTLSVNDGKHPPVIATTKLTVVNAEPVVSAGGPYTGLDHTPVPIKGTVVDPDSPGLITTWTVVPVTGTVCQIDKPQQLSTVITCRDPGLYTLILTVNDNDHENPVVVRTSLELKPRQGALSLATFVNPAPGFVGGDPVVVTFTVRNGGVFAMESVRLTTTLPAGLQPKSTFPAGCASTCNLGTLVPGQTVQVTLTFAVDAPLDQSLSAVLTTQGPDVDASDNLTRARITILQPTLTVDPTIGPQGFVTRAIGKNFPAGARVALKWSIGISDNPGEVTVGPDGTIDAQVLIFPKDARGLRVLSAISVTGPKFGDVPANPFLVVSRALKPKTFIVR
jgi:hypothetical protein